MRQFRKILSVFLVVIMLLCAAPLEGFVGIELFGTRASAASEGDFKYDIFEGEAEITEYTGDGGDVIIPSTLGGYPVTRK